MKNTSRRRTLALAWLPLFSFAITVFATDRPVVQSRSIPDSVQARIVELFSGGKCDEVNKMVKPSEISQLRPNLIAIVAFCEPDGVNSEALFEKAEGLDPTGDLILVLHAKYVSKKSHVAPNAIWEQVLKFARNPYFKTMAQEYLAGVADTNGSLALTQYTWFSDFFLGAANERNPRPPELSANRSIRPSNSIQGAANLSGNWWFPAGSLAAQYAGTFDRFFLDSFYNGFYNQFSTPVSLHAGRNEDIVFKPLGSYSTLGGKIFETSFGLGIQGVIYRPSYKQSVEGIVYSNVYHNKTLEPEGGSHYRFDYKWEFFPQFWVIGSEIFIEHVSSRDAFQYRRAVGNFNYTHTDIGLKTDTQFTLKRFILGLKTEFSLRSDSAPSDYQSKMTGELVEKTRSDIRMFLQPSLSYPITSNLHLYGWYEWNQIFSNFGSDDYINRNFINQVVGVGIKAYLSSY